MQNKKEWLPCSELKGLNSDCFFVLFFPFVTVKLTERSWSQVTELKMGGEMAEKGRGEAGDVAEPEPVGKADDSDRTWEICERESVVEAQEGERQVQRAREDRQVECGCVCAFSVCANRTTHLLPPFLTRYSPKFRSNNGLLKAVWLSQKSAHVSGRSHHFMHKANNFFSPSKWEHQIESACLHPQGVSPRPPQKKWVTRIWMWFICKSHSFSVLRYHNILEMYNFCWLGIKGNLKHWYFSSLKLRKCQLHLGETRVREIRQQIKCAFRKCLDSLLISLPNVFFRTPESLLHFARSGERVRCGAQVGCSSVWGVLNTFICDSVCLWPRLLCSVFCSINVTVI